LLEVGKWLKINGESIYGCGAFDLATNLHDWGKITCKKTATGTNIYLHVFNYPLNCKLNVTGITTEPARVYLLADNGKVPLSSQHKTAFTSIILPHDQPDPYVSVIVMEYPGKPGVSDGLVAKTIDGGYSFTPVNLPVPLKTSEIARKERRGTIPSHVVIKEKSSFRWKIYVDEPGLKRFDVSYSYQGTSSENLIILKAAGKTLSHSVMPTGKTIGEPNSGWIIDNFGSNLVGMVNFARAGYYEIDLEIIPDKSEEVKFQWLWLK